MELGGASRNSTRFGAIKKGFVSSLGGNLRFSLLFCRGSRDVYAISNRESGLDMCGGMELCFTLKLSKGFQASSRLEFGTWGYFRISNWGIRTPFVL